MRLLHGAVPFVLFLALVASPGRVRADDLRIGVDNGICDDPAALVGEVRKLVSRETGEPLTLTLSRVSPSRLRLDMAGPRSGAVSREFAFSASECPELPITVTLLVRGWIAKDWAPAQEVGA